MSNLPHDNIYSILGKLNSINGETIAESAPAAKKKTLLQESMEAVEADKTNIESKLAKQLSEFKTDESRASSEDWAYAMQHTVRPTEKLAAKKPGVFNSQAEAQAWIDDHNLGAKYRVLGPAMTKSRKYELTTIAEDSSCPDCGNTGFTNEGECPTCSTSVKETAPEGWEGTVKKMKKHKEIDNPWALANYMKDKGYKSHVKEDAEKSQLLQLKKELAEANQNDSEAVTRIIIELRKVERKLKLRETARVHKGTYGTSYYSSAEHTGEEVPAVKKGKGRPKKAKHEKASASLPDLSGPEHVPHGPARKHSISDAPPVGSPEYAEYKAKKDRAAKRKKVKENSLSEAMTKLARRLTEGVNFKEMADNTSKSIEELMSELQQDISTYKATGHASDVLKDFLQVHHHTKMQREATAPKVAPAAPQMSPAPIAAETAPTFAADHELNELARLAGLDVTPVTGPGQEIEWPEEVIGGHPDEDTWGNEELDEGGMSEVDMLMQDLGEGNADIYDVMSNPQTPVEKVASGILQGMYDDISIDYRLHPDDDFDKIINIMGERIAKDYPAVTEEGIDVSEPSIEPINGPKEEYKTMRQSTLNPGEGDFGEKGMHPDRPTFKNGDNALAEPTLESRLAAEYESIKKKVTEAPRGDKWTVLYSFDDPSSSGRASGQWKGSAPDSSRAKSYAKADVEKKGRKNVSITRATKQESVTEGILGKRASKTFHGTMSKAFYKEKAKKLNTPEKSSDQKKTNEAEVTEAEVIRKKARNPAEGGHEGPLPGGPRWPAHQDKNAAQNRDQLQKRYGVTESEVDQTGEGDKIFTVYISHNYYRGKHYDYHPRPYYVLASSPEEARSIVIDNRDTIESDLRSRNMMVGQGRRPLIRRSEPYRFSEKNIGQVKLYTSSCSNLKVITKDGQFVRVDQETGGTPVIRNNPATEGKV
ncbi:MAG TPA: hypothetical protein VFM18_19320 [Methanosarcina sp.]|nr:hypothetical protein [Methanosarcina sp.]